MQKKMLLNNKLIRRITNSIAFYPAIISTSLSLVAMFFLWVEYQPWLMAIKPNLKFFLVKSIDDSRLVLGTLVAAVISLMVFSFSMVMIVLNQASNNLSPRIVPGLVTSIENQVVLGFYLGTICYCLIHILNIYPGFDPVRVPSVGVFVSLLLGLLCLCLFTYFIHKISLSIQVDNIVTQLYEQTKKQIEKCKENRPKKKVDYQFNHSLNTTTAGYLKWIDKKVLVSICQEKNIHLKILSQIGQFHVKECPYLKSDSKLDDKTAALIHECFLFYPEENLKDHFTFGFKQISEIAVKALSPALNDPSTAEKCIDILTVLFVEKNQSKECHLLTDTDNHVRVELNTITFADLMACAIEPIRWHARNDPMVLKHLLDGLNTIESKLVDEDDKKTIEKYISRTKSRYETLYESSSF